MTLDLETSTLRVELRKRVARLKRIAELQNGIGVVRDNLLKKLNEKMAECDAQFKDLTVEYFDINNVEIPRLQAALDHLNPKKPAHNDNPKPLMSQNFDPNLILNQTGTLSQASQAPCSCSQLGPCAAHRNLR